MENRLDIPKKASLFKWLKIEKEQICYLNISLASCKVNHQASKKSLTMRQNTTELVLLHKLWRFTNQHHAFVNFQVHFGQDRWLLTESRSLCL